MQLQGKTAFITGGGGGIGGGIAEALAEKGAKLVLADIDLGYAQEEAKRIGGDVLALQLDVTSLESWAQARAKAHEKFGAVDVLCNNAGIATPWKPLDELEPELFDRVMKINVTGVYNGVVTFAPEMKAGKSGHIVNTSSMNGLLSFATFAAYSASKFAVTGMSEALRDELAPFNVGVSILYPGLTKSRMSLSPDSGAAQSGLNMEALMANMMEPVWLGRAVVRAIEQNTLHIITHPGHREAVEKRMQAILDAHGEPAQPGYAVGASATRKAE